MPNNIFQDKEHPVNRQLIPGTCTALEIQKKNKNRISVFVDNTFLAGFYQQVILDFKISVGITITDSILDGLEKAETRQLVKEHCYGWLARRAHSQKELMQKAFLKKLPADVIEDVISELNQKGLVDDKSFAVIYTREKFNLHRWGPQKIRSALFQKGLQKHYIDRALHEIITPEEINQKLYTEVKKTKNRFLRVIDPIKRKKKLVDFLARKGYHLEVILSEVESLLNMIEHEKPET